MCQHLVMLGLEIPAEDTSKEIARKKQGIGKCWYESILCLGSLEFMVEKSSSWVNADPFHKKKRQKGDEKGFSVFSALHDDLVSQESPAAVAAVQYCFQHTWFVHAAIQGVTAEQLNHTFLSPVETTLSFKFGGC